MKTLRLLLWLRWKLFLNSGSATQRWVSVAVAIGLFLAFSPLWAGGAVLAWYGVREYGAPAITVTFGLCQILWLWMGVVSGALGRTFELDKFLRYPVPPRSVFVINVAASLLEPVCLMTAPALVAVAIAAAGSNGLGAGIVTAFAGLLLSLLSATVLQVVLALLDELLRRESTRYAAGIVLPLMFLGLQLFARVTGSETSHWMQAKGLDPVRLLETAARGLALLPTIGGPAALATGALEGEPLRAAGGFAVSAALLVLGVLPAAALMRHVVRAGESAGGGPRPKRSGAGAASFALFSPPLRPALGALLARELRYSIAHPQRVASLISLPLMVIILRVTSSGQQAGRPEFVVTMLLLTVGISSMMVFSYDGPGVRSLFLLPVPARDVVLSKNLEFLARIAVELVLLLVVMAFVMPGAWRAEHVPGAVAGLGVLFVSLTIGTSLGIRFPVRARKRGSGMRGGPGVLQTLGMFALTALAAGCAIGAVWAAGKLTPEPWTALARWIVAVLAAAIGAAVWWRSLDIHAVLVRECRERIITEAGRSDVE
ncbi:MAG: hypothetical protein HZA61_06665 [Candidatus Eisenbacteria bacterium]|uniref:ABC-2 type transport system permease protein n=1 Tax=Eiseniibacteriota bacterium TaxID=2212470 RepID=A0A933W856_UNCEI|nr:hypothetical protein [Candidatus Eisenbacteria bacterium]